MIERYDEKAVRAWLREEEPATAIVLVGDWHERVVVIRRLGGAWRHNLVRCGDRAVWVVTAHGHPGEVMGVKADRAWTTAAFLTSAAPGRHTLWEETARRLSWRAEGRASGEEG